MSLLVLFIVLPAVKVIILILKTILVVGIYTMQKTFLYYVAHI